MLDDKMINHSLFVGVCKSGDELRIGKSDWSSAIFLGKGGRDKRIIDWRYNFRNSLYMNLFMMLIILIIAGISSINLYSTKRIQ